MPAGKEVGIAVNGAAFRLNTTFIFEVVGNVLGCDGMIFVGVFHEILCHYRAFSVFDFQTLPYPGASLALLGYCTTSAEE